MENIKCHHIWTSFWVHTTLYPSLECLILNEYGKFYTSVEKAYMGIMHLFFFQNKNSVTSTNNFIQVLYNVLHKTSGKKNRSTEGPFPQQGSKAATVDGDHSPPSRA